MIKRIPEIFTQPFPHWNKMYVFKKLLYGFLLINAFSLLPIAHELFANDGIVGAAGWNTKYPWYAQGSRAFLNVLSHPLTATYPWVYLVFVYGQIIALIGNVLNWWPKLTSVLIYFFTVNLFLKGYLMFTGGEALVNILTFYLIFIQRSDKGGRRSEPKFTFLQNLLNNTFYWVILIQVCVLYLFSTLYKLIDPVWVSGEALMYIARIDGFSGGVMNALFADSPLVSVIFSYATLLKKGLFPILVWMKRIKVPFLMVGVLFHLGIAFGMGVFTFGIIMIITYCLFLEKTQIERIAKIFRINTVGNV